MKKLKIKFNLMHLVLVTILLILLKITTSAMYNYIYVVNSAKDHAALQVSTMNHVRVSLLNSMYDNAKLEKAIKAATQYRKDYKLIHVTFQLKRPKNAVVLDAQDYLTSNNEFDKLVNQLYTKGELTMAVFVVTKGEWAVMTAVMHVHHDWLIPVLLLAIGGLIIIFIWVMFFSYYHHSLPKELFHFITQDRDDSRKKSKMIDSLSQQIKAFYEEKNIMLTALSHDIKTPLTEAILQCELLADEKAGSAIKTKLTEINSIISTSLDYSKDHRDVKLEKHDICALVSSLANTYEKFNFNIDVNADAAKIFWPIEPALFRRMLVNLCDNAKKYATSASIDIKHDDGHLSITIMDDGPGVPDDALEKIATPYYRVDQSRSRATGGTGLGLAIVRKIAQIHRGDVIFSNGETEGFTVRILLKEQTSS